jgi:alpha-galactosidase
MPRAASRRALPGLVLPLVVLYVRPLAADAPRVDTGPDGRSWTITNGLVERRVRFTDARGLPTEAFVRVASGTDFLRGSKDRTEAELAFRADGEDVRGASRVFTLVAADVREVTPGGRALAVRLKHRERPIEVTATFAVYDGHAVSRKWIAITNGGGRPLTLTSLAPEHLALAPGLPVETQVSAFHGSQAREIFTTGRVDDGLVLLRNARSGEGLAILNEAPGYLKRTEVLGFDWTSGVRCGYDTDLFPFERTLAPGETFTSGVEVPLPARGGAAVHEVRVARGRS